MNFKILSIPGQSSTTPTPGSLPSAPPAQNYKILSTPDQAPAQPAQPAPDKFGGVTNPLGKAVVGFGNAAEDTTKALTGDSGTALDYVNPVGWASKVFGGVADLAAKGVGAVSDAVVKPVASAI